MEPTKTYDAWEEKTRARYKEGTESHRLLALAADPHTPAPVLAEVAADALRNYNSRSDFTTDACLIVLEALAGNPNTPPPLLADLIWRSPFAYRAFCRNPITPLLLLEQPNFVADLMEQSQYALLREADAPPLFVRMLATGNTAQNEAVKIAARLHVAFAGEAESREAWETQLRDYWRAECADPLLESQTRQWYADFAEMELAPLWAVGNLPVPQPDTPADVSVLDEWFRFAHTPNSPEEAALLQRIGPSIKDQKILAQGLRKTAGRKNLRKLLHITRMDTDLVWQAILRHPAVKPEHIEEMAYSHDFTYAYLMILLLMRHPLTPPAVVARLLASQYPEVRRLGRRHPNAPPNALDISSRAFLGMTERMLAWPTPFVSFVACLHSTRQRHDLPQKTENHWWTERLEAVFLADVSDKPLPSDPEKRTGRDLLTHLSRDGNRIVRAAAQTRLVDPNYRFSLWADGEAATPPP